MPDPTPAPTPEVKPGETTPAVTTQPEVKPGENQQAPLTPEQKAAAEQKAKDDAAKAAGEFKPIKVEDIKLAEGLELDKGLAEGFVELVNKHKVSPELQAALIELQSKSQQALSGKDSEKWDETQTKWEAETKADPEIGGDKFDATMASVGKFMATFGDDAARSAFDLTGAGNHPAIVKMLAKAAALIKEGDFVPANTPGNAPKTQAEIMYPDQGKT